jgi:hypothetical protein
VNKLEKIVADEAIREISKLRDALAPMDRLLGIMVDLLRILRDGEMPPSGMLDGCGELADALGEYDFSQAKSHFDRAQALIESYIGDIEE